MLSSRAHMMEGKVSSCVILTLLMAVFAASKDARTTQEVEEFCQNESFKTKCGPDEVILMTSALYGRMRFSRCIERDYGYVGQCSVDVLDAADIMCSGRRDCEIEVPNSVLDSRRACPKDLKSYLETTHTCLKVMSSQGRRCRANQPQVLTAPTALLASVLTEESGLGSADCPWMIKAKPGQKINITLFDFATNQQGGDTCHAYAILRETEPTRSITVCGSVMRERNVYTSISNSVEIRILRSQFSISKGKYFLLKYHLIGCVDPKKPLNGWMKRDGDSVLMGCLDSSDTWRMKCKGNQWDGPFSNCTQGASAAGVLGEVTWGGISIVIIIGIALAIGVVILTVGLLILKWQRRRSAAKAARLQNENSYETNTGRKSSHAPVSPGSPKDQDPYYSTENEYAYISDIPTPPPPLPPAVPSRDNYNASNSIKRFNFNNIGGTTSYPMPDVSIPISPRPPTGYMRNTNAHGVKEDRPRYEEGVRSPFPADGIEDPPKYFELDPKVMKGESSRYQPHEGFPYPHEAQHSLGNRSIHEFSPVSYDHLGHEDNRNNKSV